MWQQLTCAESKVLVAFREADCKIGDERLHVVAALADQVELRLNVQVFRLYRVQINVN